jgi:hypothetical protein
MVDGQVDEVQASGQQGLGWQPVSLLSEQQLAMAVHGSTRDQRAGVFGAGETPSVSGSNQPDVYALWSLNGSFLLQG